VTGRGPILAFAVLGAPIAWAVQLVSGYAVEEAACSTATGEAPVLGSPTMVLWAISVAAFAVAGLAGIAGLVSWTRARARGGPEPARRVAFLGAAGALAALVFLEAIVLSAIAFVPFDPCAPA
jgi:hypothetical protein